MNSNIKLMIVSLLSVLFLLQGCSSGGGGGSSTSGGGGSSTSGGGKVSNTISKSGLFTIRFVDKNINVFDYKLSIKRGEIELTDTLLQYISSKKQDDGSIAITLKKVTTNDVSKGLDTLAVGDVITLEAKGYTAQQFVVDANMLKSDSTKVSLKPIESRQTYNLSDMTQGSDSVSARSARGARTVVTDDGVTFETLHSGISLTMPKMTYERLARKISRLPRSNTNTKVYIDMTSIDPQTEHDATIGNFSYDASSEPASERTTNAVENSGETGLESVVMADLKMTTDSGDEIHCFGDGEYDPKTDTCSDDAMATLKMQIPASQFKKYAQKYNDGDRVVPLYSYNKEKATWVRQVKNGKAIDAELVLTDNDNNQKANAGDVLTVVGKVGHFSYWNGDWGIQRTCLNVPVDLTIAPDASSYVSVKGVDYTGREYTKYVSSDTTEVKGISAKENSIVDISLIMSDGSVGDSFTYATSAQSSECEDVNTILVAPAMQKHDVKVVVKDTQGNSLQDVTVISANNRYHYTDVNGTANLTFSYPSDKDLNKTVYVYYYFDGTTVSAKKQVTQNDATLTFKLDTQESSFHGNVVESVNGGGNVAVAGAYVKIYNYNPYYYKSVRTDVNGSFEIKLPTALTKSGSTAYITIYKYNSEYAFYESYNENGRVLTPDLGTFRLAFIAHDVRGQVSDTQGNPIPSAGVSAYGAAYKYVSSDENGNYHFRVLGDVDKNETLQAYTYDDGYHYSEKKSFVTQAKGLTTKNFTIDLRKAIIRGRVLTSNGIALANMRVYWSKDYYNYVTTDENGSFILKTYNGGDGKISVYNPSSHKFLDFNKNIAIRDVDLKGVAVGKIYDLENLLAVEPNYAPIVNGITIDPNTPLVDVPFVVNVDAYDPDNDAITYKLESYYNYSDVAISMNNNIATITANSSGYYYFIVTVTDSNNNSTQKRVSVYVKNHVRPVIDSVSYVFPHKKSYFDKSTPLDIKVEAHSSEGNSLTYTYSLENLVDGKDVILDDTDSNVTIPTDIANGRYRLTITVSDLYNTTTTSRYITMDDTVAPEIDTLLLNRTDTTSLSVKENKSVSFDVNLTDAQHVAGATWYWYINGTTFTTQKISDITFDTEGYYYGYVTVRDSVGRSDYRSFYVNVQQDAKPVIDSVAVTPSIMTKLSNGLYVDGNDNSITDLTLSVDAHDDDSSSLTYEFAKLGDNTAIVNDNNATFSLDGLSEGRHSILVTVRDASSAVKTYVNIEVLKNTPPVITKFRIPLKTKISKTVALYANATDANGEDLTYKWSSTGGNLINATSKSASIEVSNIAKDINITLQVKDAKNTVTRERTLKVLDNIPPKITYFDLRTPSVVFDNQKLELKSIYGDVDGHVQSANYIVLDTNGTKVLQKAIDQSNIVTDWELNLENAGDYKIYLEVTDDNNATTKSAQASFTVEAKNSAPTISSLTATSVNLLVNEKATLNLAANDVNGDALTISWSADGGSVIRDSVLQDKATFSADKAGTYTITAVATDTGGLKAIKTIVITVQNATLSVNSDKTSYILGDEVTLTATMSSGNTLPSTTSWSVESKPDGSTLSTTANGVSITLTPDVVGTYKVKADTTINGVPFSAEYAFSVQEQSTTKPDLEGSVTSDTGDQLSGAKVRLYNKTDATIYDVTVTTDSSGAYSFSDVPAGSYYLVVYAGNGYVSQTQVVEISK